jgi:hypothetical protein
MQRKFLPLRRSTSKRIPKRKFILYTVGERTEPDYFRALGRSATGALVDFEIIDGAGVPLTIAEAASARAKSLARHRKQRSSFEESDQVWAVFDRDDHPHVADACQKCDGAGVGIALSNPCFELWLILHFSEFNRPDDRHKVQRYFESLCSDYDRTRRKTTDCSKLVPLLDQAEVRAKRQLEQRNREGSPPSPPYTTVFELTGQIKAANDAYHKAANE